MKNNIWLIILALLLLLGMALTLWLGRDSRHGYGKTQAKGLFFAGRPC